MTGGSRYGKSIHPVDDTLKHLVRLLHKQLLDLHTEIRRTHGRPLQPHEFCFRVADLVCSATDLADFCGVGPPAMIAPPPPAPVPKTEGAITGSDFPPQYRRGGHYRPKS